MIIQMYLLGENETLHETLNGVFKEEGDIEELLAIMHLILELKMLQINPCKRLLEESTQTTKNQTQEG